MTTAMISPQRDGSAVLELNGQSHVFAGVWDALAECRARGLRHEVLPFPPLSVEVLSAPELLPT